MSDTASSAGKRDTDGLVRAFHRVLRERAEAAALGIELDTLWQRYVLGLDHLKDADGWMREARQADLVSLHHEIQTRYARLTRLASRVGVRSPLVTPPAEAVQAGTVQ